MAMNRDGYKVAVACTVGRVMVFRGNCPKKVVIVHEQAEIDEFKNKLKLGDYGEFYLTEGVEVCGTKLEKYDEMLAEAAFEGKKSRRDLDKVDFPAVFHFRFTGCLTQGHKKAWRNLEHDAAVKCLAISAEGAQEFVYT